MFFSFYLYDIDFNSLLMTHSTFTFVFKFYFHWNIKSNIKIKILQIERSVYQFFLLFINNDKYDLRNNMKVLLVSTVFSDYSGNILCVYCLENTKLCKNIKLG